MLDERTGVSYPDGRSWCPTLGRDRLSVWRRDLVQQCNGPSWPSSPSTVSLLCDSEKESTRWADRTVTVKTKRNQFDERQATNGDSPEHGGVPIPPDRSGWPPHPSERRDFLSRIRAFPRDVARWRQQLLRRIPQEPAIFPDADSLSPGELQERVDYSISALREVARILAVLYGTPNLGNKPNPTDELVYIILSRKTRERAYQETFRKLKERFATWDEVLTISPRQLESLVFSGGLSRKKAKSIHGTMRRLQETFGRCSLDTLRDWSDEKVEEFLCSLPEIQKKSAYCIMMYSLGRSMFPADTHVGRILTRLGPYRELGLTLEGLDHKRLQKVLADLVPPNLRYSLHVNLVMHGRTVCRSARPLCDKCELRNLCQWYRRRESARVIESAAPGAIDLFAGAGGLSEGFVRAGFKVLGAVEQDEIAARTYRLNHPGVPDDRVIVSDIRTLPESTVKRLAGRRGLDVLAGSPPCQGFSSAGFRSKRTKTGYRPDEDERNYLYEWMVEIALRLRPRIFLMENVPGMHSAKREELSFLEAAAKMLKDRGGYRTEIWRLNASAFGVPQDRIRCFLVASRLRIMPARPVEEYQDKRRPDLDLDALPPVTLSEAIFDLPKREAGSGVPVEAWPTESSADPRARRYLTKFGILRKSSVLYEHTVRYHNPRDLELYALLRPGEDSIHILEQHGRADLMRYRKDVFDDKYARLRGDRPSKTIVAHLAKDGNGYVHPAQVRSLSLREGARIQSFHDGFVFCGSPSDQWVQLGNAVPPVLAEAIARSFRRAIERS